VRIGSEGLFELRDEDIESLKCGPIKDAFVSGFKACRRKMLLPVKETGMRVCPFCENDWVRVELETHTRNNRLYGVARGVCGVCYCEGPKVLMDFTGRDEEEVHAKIIDDAKSLWNGFGRHLDEEEC
jgi:hypothetical protein